MKGKGLKDVGLGVLLQVDGHDGDAHDDNSPLTLMLMLMLVLVYKIINMVKQHPWYKFVII